MSEEPDKDVGLFKFENYSLSLFGCLLLTFYPTKNVRKVANDNLDDIFSSFGSE